MSQVSAYIKNNLFASFGKDFFASVVVFLVALPLCMGIAIASGVPPAIGLITGIVGGIIVGAMAGSPLQVSGPAAGLSVLVFEIVQQHGLPTLGVIVLLAGLMQIAMGALKLGSWFRAISPAVVQGMLAGIGVLIIASQLHVVVDDAPRGSGLANLLAIPEAFWKGVMPLDGSTHHLAAGIGLLAVAIMIGWSYLPKKFKLVPAPLVAVVVATIVAAVWQLPIKNVSVPANLLSAVQLPTLEGVSGMLNASVFGAALAIAVIASAETLLSAVAVDRMHTGPRTQFNRELLAQGVGNTICGLLGALPMTGVIVRSSANVAAGAQTRKSAVMHGVWILAAVAALPFVLNLIPTTALAAILVYSGFKLISPSTIRELAKYGKAEVGIYAVTLAAIVATNLLEGVLIGLGLSLLKLIYTFSHLDAHLRDENGVTTLTLEGSATFVRLPKLAAALDAVPPGTRLHINLEGLAHVDHACLDLLANWREQHAATGGEMFVDWDALQHKHHGRAFKRKDDARAHAAAATVAQPRAAAAAAAGGGR
jgi:MFS superfamily sulfate permease-like transporter